MTDEPNTVRGDFVWEGDEVVFKPDPKGKLEIERKYMKPETFTKYLFNQKGIYAMLLIFGGLIVGSIITIFQGYFWVGIGFLLFFIGCLWVYRFKMKQKYKTLKQ